MKIAIASEKKEIKSNISKKGGRAPFYLIFEKKELIEIWKNPFAKGGGGAGWSVVYALDKKHIKKVIAEKIGKNMKIALKQKNIKFEEKSGKILSQIKNNN